jgi:hypothetical protein
MPVADGVQISGTFFATPESHKQPLLPPSTAKTLRTPSMAVKWLGPHLQPPRGARALGEPVKKCKTVGQKLNKKSGGAAY